MNGTSVMKYKRLLILAILVECMKELNVVLVQLKCSIPFEGSLRGKQEKLERCVEHYGIIFTASSEINRAVLETLQQFDVLEDLSTDPTFEELQQATNSNPKNNAPGNDSIPAEIYKCADQELLSKIHQILLLCWHKEDVPQDLKDARFIQRYKSKGDRSVYDNYRGISLLSIIDKIFCRILLPTLQVLGENIYPESQCGLRQWRSTTDRVFFVRKLQEKCRDSGFNYT